MLVRGIELFQNTWIEYLNYKSSWHGRYERSIKRLRPKYDEAWKQLVDSGVLRPGETDEPALREAHRRVGWYLATEILADVIGIEEYDIPHVQEVASVKNDKFYLRETGFFAVCGMPVQSVLENK